MRVSNRKGPGTSLVVQWLRICNSNAEDTDLLPSQGTKILHAALRSQKEREREKSQGLGSCVGMRERERER